MGPDIDKTLSSECGGAEVPAPSAVSFYAPTLPPFFSHHTAAGLARAGAWIVLLQGVAFGLGRCGALVLPAPVQGLLAFGFAFALPLAYAALLREVGEPAFDAAAALARAARRFPCFVATVLCWWVGVLLPYLVLAGGVVGIEVLRLGSLRLPVASVVALAGLGLAGASGLVLAYFDSDAETPTLRHLAVGAVASPVVLPLVATLLCGALLVGIFGLVVGAVLVPFVVLEHDLGPAANLRVAWYGGFDLLPAKGRRSSNGLNDVWMQGFGALFGMAVVGRYAERVLRQVAPALTWTVAPALAYGVLLLLGLVVARAYRREAARLLGEADAAEAPAPTR